MEPVDPRTTTFLITGSIRTGRLRQGWNVLYFSRDDARGQPTTVSGKS
jgi:hypothetical protein